MTTNTNNLNLISLAHIPILIIGNILEEDLLRTFKTSKEDLLIVQNSPIKIIEIRELTHFLNYKPYNSQYKLALIKSADNMTIEAGNALLKTLEEPPAYAKIILQTNDEQKILPTILSRCQKHRNAITFDFIKPENYLNPQDLSKMNYKDRFNWAQTVSETDNVADILTLWQDYYRQKLLDGTDVTKILNKILKAKDLLKTNISVKLLLENLILLF